MKLVKGINVLLLIIVINIMNFNLYPIKIDSQKINFYKTNKQESEILKSLDDICLIFVNTKPSIQNEKLYKFYKEKFSAFKLIKIKQKNNKKLDKSSPQIEIYFKDKYKKFKIDKNKKKEMQPLIYEIKKMINSKKNYKNYNITYQKIQQIKFIYFLFIPILTISLFIFKKIKNEY